MTARQIETEVNKQAVLFEQSVTNDNTALRTAKFEAIAQEWLNHITRSGDVKISSIQTYKGAQERYLCFSRWFRWRQTISHKNAKDLFNLCIGRL